MKKVIIFLVVIIIIIILSLAIFLDKIIEKKGFFDKEKEQAGKESGEKEGEEAGEGATNGATSLEEGSGAGNGGGGNGIGSDGTGSDGTGIQLPSDLHTQGCGFYFGEHDACAGICPSGSCVQEGRSCYCKEI